MSHSRTRFDPYGRPRPVLLEGPTEPPNRDRDQPRNAQMRAYAHALLDHELDAMLQPEHYGEVTLHLLIADGCLQPNVDCLVLHQYRDTWRGR